MTPRSFVAGALLLSLLGRAALADPPRRGAPAALSFPAFLAAVGRANLELAAQRTHLSAAEARILLARVFPDPSLTAGVAAIDLTSRGSATATAVGLGFIVELGGKRSARIAAASSDRATTQAELEDFIRTLRARAASAYVDALGTRLVLNSKERMLQGLDELVRLSQRRLRAGDIGQLPFLQSRNEAQRFRAEVLSAEADMKVADLTLVQIGNLPAPISGREALAGTLELANRLFSLPDLIARGKTARADILARRRALETAAARVRLARANRWVDLGFSVGWQHSFAATREFQAPAYDSLSALVTTPILFSRLYAGELREAWANQEEARHLLARAELQVETEVRQTFVRYTAARARLQILKKGVLADAEKVRDATLYSYGRGGTSLLEVLIAQRALGEIYLDHAAALREHAQALVALETAAGIWDIVL